MRASFFHPVVVLLAVLLAGPAVVAQQNPGSDDAVDSGDSPFQDGNVVIVAGGTNLGSVVGSDLPASRHWVALGGLNRQGVLTTIPVSACAETTVEFSLSVPKEAGFNAPTAEVHGVVLSSGVLNDGRWGEVIPPGRLVSEYRISESSSSAPMYCIAYTTSLRLAETGAEQRVSARVKRDSLDSPLTRRALQVASENGQGVVYEFPGVRRDRRSGHLVIVDRSVPDVYGFANSRVTLSNGEFGTYAVVLASWTGTGVQPPTPAECREGRVKFALQAATSPGFASQETVAQAEWVDWETARRLFPETTRGRVDGFARDSLRNGSRGNAPYLCVAEAPLQLSAEVGYQRVVARVQQTGTRPLQSLVEDLRQSDRTSPGAITAFQPVRVHARPRAVFGLIWTPAGDVWSQPVTETEQRTTIVTTEGGDVIQTTRTEEVEADTTEGSRLATMAGVDFAVQPVLDALSLGRIKWGTPVRVVAATNISGDAFDRLYIGISGVSIFSMPATGNPIDFSFGVASPVDEWDPLFAMSATIDLKGTLAVLKDVIAL